MGYLLAALVLGLLVVAFGPPLLAYLETRRVRRLERHAGKAPGQPTRGKDGGR